MNRVANIDEVEKERQEYISDAKDPEDDWEGMSKPGGYGCHELLDRTALIMKNVEEFIVSHPACLENKAWFALARQASEALHELYQQVGAEHLEKTADQKQLTTDG